MAYLIKQLSLKHIDEITSIVSYAIKNDFPEYKKETNLAYLQIFNKEFFTKFLKDHKKHIFSAFSKNVLTGFVCMKEDFGGVLFIDWLVVKKEFRKKGVGTFLLNETAKWALKNKFHYLYLFTESNQNIAFYEKRGFRYIGKHLNSWFGETEHELGKSLRDKPFPEIFSKK